MGRVMRRVMRDLNATVRQLVYGLERRVGHVDSGHQNKCQERVDVDVMLHKMLAEASQHCML